MIGPLIGGRFLTVVATPDSFGSCAGAAGPGVLPQVEKREQYARLIAQGFSSLEARRALAYLVTDQAVTDTASQTPISGRPWTRSHTRPWRNAPRSTQTRPRTPAAQPQRRARALPR